MSFGFIKLILFGFLFSVSLCRSWGGDNLSPEEVRKTVEKFGVSSNVNERLKAAELTQSYPLYLGDQRLLGALRRQMYDSNIEVRMFAFATIKDISYAANPTVSVPERVAFVDRLAEMLEEYIHSDNSLLSRSEAESAMLFVRKSAYYLRK